jgi:hypothetical protein
MNHQKRAIEKKSFVQRFIVPSGIVLLTMIISLFVYYNAWRIDNDSLHWIVAYIFGLLLFISIGFGSLLVYPLMFFRGASGGERVLGSLITPIIWSIKELVRVSEFFTLGESLYYGLSSIFLLIFLGNLGLMGIVELICRRRIQKRIDPATRVITPLPVIAILIGLLALYIIFIWGVGVHWFYIYQEGYKALFH